MPEIYFNPTNRNYRSVQTIFKTKDNKMIDLDSLTNIFCDLTELKKDDEKHIVNDDTQVGIEFAYEQIQVSLDGKQIIDNAAISYLYDNHPEAYKGFYERVNGVNNNE